MGANGATGEVSAVRMPQGETFGHVLTWAETHISSAHMPIEGGPVHGHTWRVRAYWYADGTDAMERASTLHIVTRGLDHTLLPRELSRAEDIATWLGRNLGGVAVQVDVWREAEGLGARWQR